MANAKIYLPKRKEDYDQIEYLVIWSTVSRWGNEYEQTAAHMLDGSVVKGYSHYGYNRSAAAVCFAEADSLSDCYETLEAFKKVLERLAEGQEDVSTPDEVVFEEGDFLIADPSGEYHVQVSVDAEGCTVEYCADGDVYERKEFEGLETCLRELETLDLDTLEDRYLSSPVRVE